MYLAVAGNIGAGKSTLTRLLSARYHLTPVFEAVDENPYLADFYRDMSAYAFRSQVFFLAKRLEQHLGQVNTGDRIVQDRTIFEDAGVFARNLFEQGMLTPRDFETYMGLYRALAQALRPPDLLLYLRAGVPTLQRRIAARGRGFERDVGADYLSKLNVLYESWLADYVLSEVLTIDADEADFLRQAEAGRLFETLEKRGLGVPVL
ncbi:deoxynucleoside kinase [soil metagenome]